ncbi:MAG: GntR family transcriptional regulator [Candidatus Omnitrophota bacterium]
MKIDRNNSLPLYIQVRENLRSQIESGEIKPLESLPNEADLCNQYQVSQITIKKSLSDLQNEGYITRIKRKGTFVTFNKSQGRRKEDLRVGTKSLAFIVPDVEDIFISEICRGIEKAATGFGYRVLILNSDRNIEKEAANIGLLEKSDIEGAVIFPFWGRFNALQIFNLKKRKFPFVLIDRYFRDIQTDLVVVDNFNGALQAVGHLSSQGHKKIAHIMGVECTANEDRFEGYRAALQKADIPFNLSLVRKIQPFEIEGSLRFEPDDTGGYREMKALLSRKERLTAVFAGNDYIALGCYKAIKEAGLRVPDDIALVGFDDLKFSAHLEVPLTTVHQPKDEIGTKACETLIGKIRRGTKKMKHIVLPAELVVRESSRRKTSSGCHSEQNEKFRPVKTNKENTYV